MQFDYFYNKEAHLFSFLQIPKYLISDIRFKHLSAESKLLYGLFLDRVHLSAANNWMDDHNRIYIIYTLEEIMNDIGYKHDKCTKLLKELDSIGLIERKRQGLGKPDIIYVKNFVKSIETSKDESFTNGQISDCGNTAIKNAELSHSGMRKNRTPECGNIASNNTDNNKNDLEITTTQSENISVDEQVKNALSDIGINKDKDIQSIYKASGYNFEKCKVAINNLLFQNSPIRNQVGWLIKALKDDYSLVPNSVSRIHMNGQSQLRPSYWGSIYKNQFNRFTQRDDYDFEELERRLVKN